MRLFHSCWPDFFTDKSISRIVEEIRGTFIQREKVIHLKTPSDIVWFERFLESDHTAPTRKTFRKAI